ncbi:MAG: TldD/PmbA family protein [Ruminococcaceae bacterium]|nr:TldD/PmbA family protein [Oscillospiraceae bacterium]
MNFNEIKELLFAEAKKAGLTDYDVYFRMSSDAGAEALNKELSSCAFGTKGGVSFRCAIKGRIGSAASQCLEKDAVTSLVSRAMANAEIIDADEEPIFFEGSGKKAYRTVSVAAPALPDAAELRRAAMTLQEQLYAESELMTDGTSTAAGAALTHVALANSKGLCLSHRAGMRYTYAEAIVNDGNEPSFGSAFAATVSTDTDIAKKATAEALARLGAGAVKTGSYDVIFAAKQMRSLLSAFAGIFSGKNAMLGLSLLAGKEGQRVASELLTVIDDPFYAENPMQMPFDAEGVATKEKNLIENGVLKTLLYDLTYAKKAGKEPTGNAARGIADPVSISPYCLRIAPGKDSPAFLRQKLGNGIYINELKGLHAGADAVTGDFSIESAGFLIENGKLTKPVHSFTVAGNFFDLLKAIDGIADNVEMGLPAVSGTAAPDVLVRNLSVAGE